MSCLGVLELALELLDLFVVSSWSCVLPLVLSWDDSRGQDDPDQVDQHDEDDQDFSRGGHQTSPGPESGAHEITAQFNLIYLSFKSVCQAERPSSRRVASGLTGLRAAPYNQRLLRAARVAA